ncbi:MAG: tetratricopeptide repeat protein [SAR324 cluster bacterium]|nr:tetratricopeptide repeat protein [SAR324 cluster bacterium]
MIELNSEKQYRLGNDFFDAGKIQEASHSWKNSILVSSEQSLSLIDFAHRNKLGVIAISLITIVSLYTLVFTIFPRQYTFLDLLISSSQPLNGDESWWDEWWDKRRPLQNQHVPYWEMQNIRHFREYFLGKPSGADQIKQIQENFLKWFANQKLRTSHSSPINYNLLLGKGFFNARDFDNAIEILKQGIQQSRSKQELGILYQELGTVYYYQGYFLQADGLAKYDLMKVKLSVEAYLQAVRYVEGPFLFGNLGWGLYLTGEYESAIDFSKKALQFDETLNYVRMNMGLTYIRMGKNQEAFDVYESILKYNPEVTEYEGGVRDLKELIKQHPGEYPFINFILGYIFYQQGFYTLAVENFEIFQGQTVDAAWRNKASTLIHYMQISN